MSEQRVGTRFVPGRDYLSVLGIVFSHRDLAPPHNIELELSLLQLAYAVCRLWRDGWPARGYFGVVQPDVHAAAVRLHGRLGMGDDIRVVFQSMLVSDLLRLAAATDAAIESRDPSTLKSVSHEIALGGLRREIMAQEPGIEEHAGGPMPFDIAWDFLGTVPLRGPPGSAA